MAAEAPITLKETLELLRAVKPEQMYHYTPLVSQAIRDGELAFQDRDGHSIQIESRPRSTFNDNGRKFAWTFEGIVDGRACEVTVTLSYDEATIFAETVEGIDCVKGKYSVSSTEVKTLCVKDVLFALAKKLPPIGEKRFKADADKHNKVVLAIKNLQDTLKKTRMTLVRKGDKFYIIPSKVQVKSMDTAAKYDFDFMKTDFYIPVPADGIANATYLGCTDAFALPKKKAKAAKK
jgi:hypothetical protein